MVNLDFMRDRLRRGSEVRIRRAAPELLRRLRADVPVAEDGGGTMRDSISVTPQRLSVEVRVAVDYASYVVEGTPSHRIPTSGNTLLAFEWPRIGPGTFYFMNVEHPGTDANDWYSPVIDEWPRILERTPA